MPDPPPAELVAAPDDPRADRAVHALAQAPPRARLRLLGNGPVPASLAVLIRAYGLQDRVIRGGSEAGAAVDPERFATAVESLYGTDDPPQPLRPDDAWLRGERIVVVTNHPAHYRVPLFNGVAARVQEAGGAFRVLFQSAGYARRSWMRPDATSFDHRVLRSTGVRLSARRTVFVSLNLEAELRRARPSIVVSGGFSPVVSGRVSRFARRAGVPFGLWSGETRSSAATRAPRSDARRRRLARGVSFGLAYGALSREYLRDLRPDLPVVIARNTTALPGGETEPGRPGDGPLRLLTVADLSTPGKGIESLIDAARDTQGWTLTVAGGGRGLAALRARASGLADRVRFTGAVPSDRIGEHYRAADAFAFPSRVDIFGLVLVEAMGLGLPVLTGRRPGAVADLCDPGRNAMVLDTDDSAAWRDAVRALAADPGRAGLGAAARRTIERRWTIDHAVDAFLAALRLGRLTAP